ncbi:MAG: RIP metalloprotease RseP [Alistipes sp.]|nr:RIP metalloprotease RseP [Candidatus Alistipes equi]
MDVIIKILQFFLCLTLLVGIHEFGHFIAARIFKIRVEKFYIFFDIGYSLFHFRHKDTEFGVGWLPLGGYCKIAGMVDESLDKEQLSHAPKDYEFRSKPAWQRFIVLAGGVTMNVIAAYCIYTGIAYGYGSSYIDNTKNVYGVECTPTARALGFMDGDRILSLDGKQVTRLEDVQMSIILSERDVNIDVQRAEEQLTIVISKDNIKAIRTSEQIDNLFSYRQPFVVNEVQSSEAKKAGLQSGDVIVAVEGVREFNSMRYRELLRPYASERVCLTVVRDGVEREIFTTLSSDAMIGVSMKFMLPLQQKQYTFVESIAVGFKRTNEVIADYWKQLKLLVKPQNGLYKQLGGFISIGNIFPSSWDWLSFWQISAFISIVLAIMNVIPIPGLDGGHIMFTLWEMITGRKVSDRVLLVAQYIGLILILMLFIFANGNDVHRLLK